MASVVAANSWVVDATEFEDAVTEATDDVGAADVASVTELSAAFAMLALDRISELFM